MISSNSRKAVEPSADVHNVTTAKRRFQVEIVRTIIVEVDEVVFKAVTNEWRETFYKLSTDADVVEHIAFNLDKGRPLSTLDGFADQADAAAKIVDDVGTDITVEEVT